VIPSLGIARATVNGLHLDKATAAKMASLRAGRKLCGFGEIPGFVFSDSPDLDAIYKVAEANEAPINLHIDLAKPGNTETLEAAMTAHPKARFVLAHLGWTAGSAEIGRLLDAHPNMYTDLSIRFDPVGSLPWRNNGLDLSILTKEGAIPSDWRAVIARHPDRFLFAMDINSFGPRFSIMEDLIVTGRNALAPLPEAVRNAIAHGNTERLYSRCND
jgi:predicted TIM-barrel fold metal-dependent hydrolase